MTNGFDFSSLFDILISGHQIMKLQFVMFVYPAQRASMNLWRSLSNSHVKKYFKVNSRAKHEGV